MCNFFSAIAFRDGSIHADPEHTDSHEDLVHLRGLDDSGIPHARSWVRVEYSTKERLDDLDSYTLRADCPEDERPSWWKEREEQIRDACRSAVMAMVITDTRELLLGGCWILAGDAKIDRAANARILAMYDTSSVGHIYNSSSVGAMYGSSRVGVLHGSSRVEDLHGSSSVGVLRGSSRVDALCDSSSVGKMYNSSRVDALCGSSSVGKMYNSSSVGYLYDSSRVDSLHDSSNVGTPESSAPAANITAKFSDRRNRP